MVARDYEFSFRGDSEFKDAVIVWIISNGMIMI
jgi:hypothetical protein